MEQQAGEEARIGSADANAVRGSGADGRERALAGEGNRTASAATAHGGSSATEPQGMPPAGPQPPSPADSPVTGQPRVDAALKLLDRLPGLPVSDHPDLFEQVHAQLSGVLGELDSGAGDASPAGAEG